MKDASTPQPIGLAYLIDDEAFDQKMYQRIISRTGLVRETKSFLAADHALEHLRAHPEEEVDAIFLDINMPRMTGFEFLETATEELGPTFAKVCIVMLTTSLDPGDRARAETFAVVKDFLNKPLKAEDVHHVAQLVEQNASATS